MTVEPFRTQRILFLGEQDGPTKRALKNALNFYLNESGLVRAAYLLRVSFSEVSGVNIALAIYPKTDSASTIASGAAEVFKRLFNPTEHLDILFLDEELKSQADKVAKPFWVRE